MASPDKFYLTSEKTLKSVSALNNPEYDGVLLVTYPADVNVKPPSSLIQAVEEAVKLDKGLKSEVAVIHCPHVAGSRLVISPTGPITPYDDVRSLYDAAKKGMNRALKAGIKKPILVLQDVPAFKDSDLVLCLGVLDALYVPLQVRDSGVRTKVDRLGLYGDSISRNVDKVLQIAIGLDQARIVARDVAGGDPERMCPPNVEAYIRQSFAGDPCVDVEVQDDLGYLEKEYPLLAAVNRGANEIERHRGRVIFIKYVPEDATQITNTVMLVGKGVTYDTGGVDVKHGGNMAGMSRDKSGAGAVAGFMKACQLLRPKHTKAIAVLGVVRNSIGENSYVADELIIARSGARVRVGNTDAEGRMIMADLLCLMKDQAKNEVNPHLYTVATLTGHSLRAVGIGYGIVIDNHAARKENHAKRLQASGDCVADVFEISTLRRDDFLAHRGTFEGDDTLQSGNGSSTATDRGHQKPAGFLIIASGLEGKDIKYSHLEIAPSAGIAPEEPTGSPMMALAHFYNIWSTV